MLSFVLPIYNTEPYLLECLLSVEQSSTPAEIIAINDGSTDGGLNLLEEYAKGKSWIKIITVKNGGLSAARNLGLTMASGDYIYFLDSDDVADIDNLLELYAYGRDNQLDLIQGQAIKFWGDISSRSEIYRRVRKRSHGDIVSGPNFFSNFTKSRELPITVWSNIYNRKFLLDNALYFREGIIHEDEDWVPRAFIMAERVAFLDRVILHYRQRLDSICQDGDVFLRPESLRSILLIVEDYCSGESSNILRERDRAAWKVSVYRLYLDLLKRRRYHREHPWPYVSDQSELEKKIRKSLGFMYYSPKLIKYRWRTRP